MTNAAEELREHIKDTQGRYREGNRKRLEATKTLEKTGPILLTDNTWVDANKIRKAYYENLQNQIRVSREMGFNEPLGELEAAEEIKV